MFLKLVAILTNIKKLVYKNFFW